jgi:hypothetical protein
MPQSATNEMYAVFEINRGIDCHDGLETSGDSWQRSQASGPNVAREGRSRRSFDVISSCWVIMRLMFASISLVVLVSSAWATSVDPHIIFATGGDATDITTKGTLVTLSQMGGGIFVFHNATGGPLSRLQVNVQFPVPSFPNGFVVDETIFIPSLGQQSTFSDTLFNGATCDGQTSDSFSCLKMVFGLIPNPLIGTDQNFVLDFYFPLTAVDDLVATGNYSLTNCKQMDLGCTGTTNLSTTRSGDWPDSASVSATPVLIPEPGTLGALFIGGVGLGIYCDRRKNSAR